LEIPDRESEVPPDGKPEVPPDDGKPETPPDGKSIGVGTAEQKMLKPRVAMAERVKERMLDGVEGENKEVEWSRV